ncbi:hypothetical protein [Phenylobacterium sp.]|uniref:hypothetical protein n=1 Tax=Phenylobacterium sp. TaxID=1871053 RepID=UPI0027378183|nr:hypothetical protein [Phenylobacterium sp.]MDP3869934.1 hypothetical protein [Phenylobacterium sp.]
MSRATEDALSALHAALAKSLAAKIEDGTATAADLSVARAFLKENGITAIVAPRSPLSALKGALEEADPFDDDEEIAAQRAIFSGAPAGRA